MSFTSGTPQLVSDCRVSQDIGQFFSENDVFLIVFLCLSSPLGVLIDQLMGPQITLYSLSWHPTRSFIAVGTSDGLVDIWGPRLDWTAFAPDFQALQKNVEYIEKEDEFDVIVDGDHDEEAKRLKLVDEAEERMFVDITSVSKVPAFEFDSEGEEDLFYFGQGLDTRS